MVRIPEAARSRAGDASRQVIEEAERALIALGYRPAQASRAISNAYVQGHTTEAVVRSALKSMAAQEA